MFKNIFIRLLFLLVTVSSSTQNIEISWAKWIPSDQKNLIDTEMILTSNTGFYTWSTDKIIYRKQNIYINHFDSKGDFIDFNTISLPTKNASRQANLNAVFSTSNDEILIFSTLALNKDHSHTLFLQKYTSNSNTFDEPKVLIDFKIEKLSKSGYFKIAQSPDKKFFVVLVQKPFQKKEKEKSACYVFDENFTLLWKKDFELNYLSQRAYNESIFISNNGDIILTKIANEFKKEAIFTSFLINEETIFEQIISENEFFPTSYDIVYTNEKSLLTGFYTNFWKPRVSLKGRKDQGVFLFDFTSKKLLGKHKWSEKITRKILGNKIGNMKLINTLQLNGNLYIIGDETYEDRKTIKSNSSNIGTVNYDYTYTNGPGLIACLKLNGDFVYTSPFDYYKIAKNEMKRTNSFYPFFYNNELYILGNGRESKYKKKKISVGPNRYVVTFNEIDKLGEILYTPIWNTDTGGVEGTIIFSPLYTHKIDENNYYIHAFGKNYQVFGRLIIN